jgi:MarR family transcriptional regulator, organic hydroperoxide resistance regulator
VPHPTSGRPDLALSMHAFGAFHQTVLGYRQLLMRGMSAHGLHPGQAFAVGEISHREGITQAELAESLGVSRPTVTVMLQKLEKQGVVERRTDPDDQRYTRIYLTDEGRARYRVMHTVLGELAEKMIEPMTAADRAELVRLLGILSDNIQAALAEETER